MVELTNRENLLIVLLSTIVNPLWNDKPWDIQYQVFRSLQALHAPGKFSDDELKDLVDSIHGVYEQVYGKAQLMMKNK